ncbi:MAG: DUF4156 domain-containing protein [Methylococcaceae bacterium]|nr:DUF4156 domain-containing protein [Methylococcaceae bacterium]
MLRLFKVMMLLCFVVLHGCAKYKGWEDVKIIDSVVGEPCNYLEYQACTGNKKKCDTWLKKRAATVKANTIVIYPTADANTSFGNMYDCHVGLPPYEPLQFSKEGYKKGSNAVAQSVTFSQDAPKDCEYKGEIYGKAKSEWDVEVATRGARDSLRKQASEMGANYVHIQDTTSGKVMGWMRASLQIVMIGNAYYCEKKENLTSRPTVIEK